MQHIDLNGKNYSGYKLPPRLHRIQSGDTTGDEDVEVGL